MRRRVTWVLLLLLIGCGPPSIDGLAVGDRRCTARDVSEPAARAACDRFTTFGLSTLESVDPEHAPVVAVEVYRDPVTHVFGGFGDRSIVVLRLEDDTARAFYLQCGVGLSEDFCFIVEPDQPPGTD
jgi:hypothetical protein